MNKSITRSILVIAIVLVAFAIVWVVYDIVKKEPANANIVDSNLNDENTGLDNVINSLFEEVESNEVKQNETFNNILNGIDEKNEIEKEKAESETVSGSVTSREKKAVELVKDFWGEDDSVYFSYQSIDNQGRYIVSVNRKDSSVLAWFKVDVDNEIVTKM